MTEILPEPSELLQQKLEKIKCCTGCLNDVNYLVFGHGLYCTACLSKIKHLNNDQFINLGNTSSALADLVEQYKQKNKGQLSQINNVRGEVEASKNKLKKIRDSLVYDAKTVKSKASNNLQMWFKQCEHENKNKPMEDLYEPNLSATLVVNQSDLLDQNLKNLSVIEEKGQVLYEFSEKGKNPQEVNKKVQKNYKQLLNNIQAFKLQTAGILNNFRSTIKN